MRWEVMWSLVFALGATVGCQPKAVPAPDAQPAPAVGAIRKDRLAKPMRIHITLDGKPVDEVIYPFLGDIEGDGASDLLIGTRMKGRLLVYPDVRVAAEYRLTTPQWFDDREPTGRIPAG